MKKIQSAIVLALILSASAAHGQGAAPAQAAAPRNLRFDIVISEGGTPRTTTKTLTLMMTDRDPFGSIRNNGRLPPDPTARPVTTTDKDGKTQTTPAVGMSIPLNIDVRDVAVLPNDQIRARVNVEYQPYLPESKTQPAMINAGAAMVFDNGKKATIVQTVDPISDRHTTIEVTATVVK